MQQAVYSEFRRVVYDATGISLGPSKQALVAARVSKRMRALGLSSYRSYLTRVAEDGSGEEMRELIDAICTNVTHFFREEDHFAFARGVVLERVTAGQRRFRLWSAACSTGEEPYSLAMALGDLAQHTPDIDLRVLATDLSRKALRIAMAGRYDRAKVSAVHPRLLHAYFTRTGRGDDAVYTIAPEIRERVAFRRLNLSEPPFPIRGPLDMVLCRNVMIYFDQPVREALLTEIHRVLSPGGYLLVGHAESLSGTRTDFVPVAPSIYMRP